MVSFGCNNLAMELSFDTLDTPALTKAHLSKILFEKIGLNKREAKDFIDTFFDLIISRLIEGEAVKISGFGNFEVKSKEARPGRNPKTREPVNIPPRRVVTFRPSGQLKADIN